MKRYDQISGIFWLACGILILLTARPYSFGSFREPGGGLYPALLGVLLVILGGAVVIQSIKKSRAGAPSWNWKEGGIVRCLLTLFGVLAAAFLFEYVGFFLATFLFVLFMGKAVLALRWLTSLAMSLLFTGGGYFFFGTCLKIQFPQGWLGL